MAITKEKKQAVVAKVASALEHANLVVLARYTGLSVANMQQLRREARESDVTLTVAKNRLVKIALAQAKITLSDPGVLIGQLALALGPDEVAPAQVAATFAKSHPALEIIGGIARDGRVMSADEVKALASLPSKDVLRAQLVGTIAAPLSGFVQVLAGNVRGLVNVLNARASALE